MKVTFTIETGEPYTNQLNLESLLMLCFENLAYRERGAGGECRYTGPRRKDYTAKFDLSISE